MSNLYDRNKSHFRIAILGATSQIARDLVQSFAANDAYTLVLFARRPQAVHEWLARENLSERYAAHGFEVFSTEEHFDAILNFVGVGDPAQAAAMGASIFDVTLKYDEMVLAYLQLHPDCRYIFLSSGAAYGTNFDAPVDENTNATIDINNLQPQSWYGVAKLHAESRHRALSHLQIIDLRIFNYFSHTQNLGTRFLITDIIRAIFEKTELLTSNEYIMRDYIHPSDFYKLVLIFLSTSSINTAVDCYSKAPLDKQELLEAMNKQFSLLYKISSSVEILNSTGKKPYYYSLNTAAAKFGYSPDFTSLEGVLKEAAILLEKMKSNIFVCN